MLSVQQPNGTYFDLKYNDSDVIGYAQMLADIGKARLIINSIPEAIDYLRLAGLNVIEK